MATDSRGDVYALAQGFIHVYGPNGKAIVEFEDEFKPRSIAVDSACNVYVRDFEVELNEKEEPVEGVTYYTPSTGKCPPEATTTYSRHGSTIVTSQEFPKASSGLREIAVNPGPSKGKDQLFVESNNDIRRYDSAANESKQLDAEFGKVLSSGPKESITVNGANGTVYVGANSTGIDALNEAGTEVLAHFDTKGSTSGKSGISPFVAVDPSNGHVISYDGSTGTVHEYDAAGSFLAEFGSFIEGQSITYDVAVDSACAIHEPPLTETTTPTCKEFDPSNGNVYVAFDDSKTPFDVTAFGPLRYGPGTKNFPSQSKRLATVAAK